MIIIDDFVLSEGPMIVQRNTKKEDKEMEQVDFHMERRAMEQAVYTASHEYEVKAREKYHINTIRPKTVKEVFDLLAAKKFEPISDEKMNEVYEWGNPIQAIRFREHPADKDGYEKSMQRHIKERAAVILDINVLAPEKALEKVRSFENRTVH